MVEDHPDSKEHSPQLWFQLEKRLWRSKKFENIVDYMYAEAYWMTKGPY